MAVYILPVALICLAIAVIIWTWLSVLKNGFSLRVRDPVTGIWYTKVSRVLMWWFFATAVTFITGVTTDDRFIALTGLVLLVGGIAAGYYIAKTAKFEDEMLMSSRSLRISSAVALVIGVFAIGAPLLLLLPSKSHFSQQNEEIIAGPFFGIWLIYESKRLKRESIERAAIDRESAANRQAPRIRSSDGRREGQWWISWVLGRNEKTPHKIAMRKMP